MLSDAGKSLVDDFLRFLEWGRSKPRRRRKRRWKGHAHSGHVLTAPERAKGLARANAGRAERIAAFDAQVIDRVIAWRAKGWTFRDITFKLGKSTRTGGWWSPSAVHRLLARYAKST